VLFVRNAAHEEPNGIGLRRCTAVFTETCRPDGLGRNAQGTDDEPVDAPPDVPGSVTVTVDVTVSVVVTVDAGRVTVTVDGSTNPPDDPEAVTTLVTVLAIGSLPPP
jgi:hypothetical protein